MEMTPSFRDLHHLSSAEGWLELGNWQFATEELENIAREFQRHPSVLAMRFRVHSAANNWKSALGAAEALVKVRPGDHEAIIHRSFALHELKRTEEAQQLLLPALDEFPGQWVIPYNLACYACQLGQLDAARALLERAIKIGDAREIEGMALEDPDLAPLKATGAL